MNEPITRIDVQSVPNEQGLFPVRLHARGAAPLDILLMPEAVLQLTNQFDPPDLWDLRRIARMTITERLAVLRQALASAPPVPPQAKEPTDAVARNPHDPAGTVPAEEQG